MEKKEGRIKKFFGEFKKFITRGNVLDMAVGVIVGGAFTAIVNGMSNFILKPIINWLIAILVGDNGLESAVTILSPAWLKDTNGAFIYDEAGEKMIDLANSIYIDWGSFISAIINFLIIAFVLFMIVRTMNRIAASGEKFLLGFDLKESKGIAKIRREEKVSRKEAKRIYRQRIEEAKAKQAEEERLAAEKAALEAAEAAARAEEKTMMNIRLLEEIRDLLKNK